MRGLVDQNEGASGRDIIVPIDRQRFTRGERHATNVVHAQRAFRVLHFLQFVDIAMRQHCADLCRRQSRAVLEQVLARRVQRLRIEPAPCLLYTSPSPRD